MCVCALVCVQGVSMNHICVCTRCLYEPCLCVQGVSMKHVCVCARCVYEPCVCVQGVSMEMRRVRTCACIV